MISAIEAATGCPVSRETYGRLEAYVALLRSEAQAQNLIAASTLETVWQRHIADSAQLVPLAVPGASWADLGSGAGLPGLVVAILTGDPMTLIEPRRLRAEFLQMAAETLGLANVSIIGSKAQVAEGRFDVITARAVAPAGDLLGMSCHLAHSETRFLLMKGRSAKKELEDARRAWQGDFRLVASRTDAEAAIIVAERVRRRGGRA